MFLKNVVSCLFDVVQEMRLAVCTSSTYLAGKLEEHHTKKQVKNKTWGKFGSSSVIFVVGVSFILLCLLVDPPEVKVEIAVQCDQFG